MRKSICIEKIFLEHDFYDRFACVAKAGFTYLEFGCWCNRDLDRIKRETDKYGLTITNLSGDYKASLIVPGDQEEFLDYLKQSIEAAQKLKCKNICIHSQAMNENGQFTSLGDDLDDVTKIANAALTGKEAAKLAEEADVTLVLEAVNNISKPGYYMTSTVYTGNICKAINSPNFKILYDIWHMQLMEGNLVSTLKKYADVLGYIHVGDCPERHEPGTGEINFNKIKKVVCEDLGLDLVWGFELDPLVNSVDCCKKITEF
jgi:hydroxypyruvate isomerase